MQTNNNKLKERAIRIIEKSLGISKEKALELFKEFGSIRKVIENQQLK